MHVKINIYFLYTFLDIQHVNHDFRLTKIKNILRSFEKMNLNLSATILKQRNKEILICSNWLINRMHVCYYWKSFLYPCRINVGALCFISQWPCLYVHFCIYWYTSCIFFSITELPIKQIDTQSLVIKGRPSLILDQYTSFCFGAVPLDLLNNTISLFIQFHSKNVYMCLHCYALDT